MLVVDKLTKSFGQFYAIENVSFSIRPKEVFALIGSNGAGKTTTIKTILGLYQKDSGSVSFMGTDATADSAKIREKIAYIPDEPLFYPYLTGFEVLDFIKILHKITQNEFDRRLSRLLKIYPLGSILSDYPENYSRGNKQKLSIISAFLHDPMLLLVDEPIVGLDPESSEKTIELFSDFVASNGMILVSTHTLSFVEKIATHIGIISHGKMKFTGSLTSFTKKEGKSRTLVNTLMSLMKNA